MSSAQLYIVSAPNTTFSCNSHGTLYLKLPDITRSISIPAIRLSQSERATGDRRSYEQRHGEHALIAISHVSISRSALQVADNDTCSAYAPALVTIVTDQIVYAYQPLELIIAYAGSVAISILAVILGLFAARSNGIIHVSTFSALVRATRNPELDRLFADENMAGYPLSKYLDEQRLRFGQLAPQFVGPDSRQQDYVKTVFATEDRLMAR